MDLKMLWHGEYQESQVLFGVSYMAIAVQVALEVSR